MEEIGPRINTNEHEWAAGFSLSARDRLGWGPRARSSGWGTTILRLSSRMSIRAGWALRFSIGMALFGTWERTSIFGGARNTLSSSKNAAGTNRRARPWARASGRMGG